jgi:Flp pilus assembly protein CpaB
MNKRRGGLVLILFGLVLAGVVGYLVLRVTEQATSEKVQTIDVVVALQDIPERTILTSSLVAIRPVLPDGLPPTVLTRPEQVNGQMTTTRIFAGEMILNSRLADTKGNSGIAYALEKGKVLVTLPGSDIVGLNAVRPGDHVDLLMTVLPAKESGAQSGNQASTPAGQPAAQNQPTPTADPDAIKLPFTTQVAMQNLVVVGLGPIISSAPGQPAGNQSAPTGGSLITFAVPHQDAVQLTLMKDHERLKLELVLRAAGDETIVETEPYNLQKVLERYQLVKKAP